MKKNINGVCSHEQLKKFLNKVIIWNLSFMDRPTSGKLIEINKDYFVIEMLDGRTLVARIDTVIAFAMARKQPKNEAL